MAKVYISSTYLDLKDHREKLERSLRRLGHEVVSADGNVPGDEVSTEKLLRAIVQCDLYIGIFAWRYGWVPPNNNPERLSITEIAYQEARKNQKPCLIFLLSEDAPWPLKFIDRDRSSIERLRHILQSQQSVEFFRTTDDLATTATFALSKLGQEHGFATPGITVPSINLPTYFAALSRRYRNLDLNALTPPQKDEHVRLQLRSVFVEQSVREDLPPVELPKELWDKLQQEREVHADDLPIGLGLEDLGHVRESYLQKTPRPVIDVLGDENYSRIVILGNPGSGKSTLSRYVLLSLISDTGDSQLQGALQGYLPLLLELRSYAGLNAEHQFDTFLDFIDFISRNDGWGLDKESLHRYLKTGGEAVVIFDGLDEIFNPAEREEVTQRIVQFSTDYPKVRIVITSRIIGYRRQLLTDTGFVHFTLQDLNEEQVAQFVNRWYSLALADQPEEANARRERILSSFKSSSSIRQLAGNPMLLTIMVIIGKHQELPRERWKLYDHAASVLLEHWDVNKHLTDRHLQAEVISEEDKKELLRRLAYRMQGAQNSLSGNYIYREQLELEFETYLKERFYPQDPERANAVARAMIDQLRERNFILVLYGANLYGFVHRAFLEFFCASAIVVKFEKTWELTLEQLKLDVFGTHWEDKAWHEVLRLICGMIGEKFAGEIISYLATNNEKGLAHSALKLTLAVQCLSEIRNLNIITESTKHLLRALCLYFESFTENFTNDLSDFIKAAELLSALTLIGANWPDRTTLVDWLKGYRPQGKTIFNISLDGYFIGEVGQDHKEIHRIVLDYLNHSDEKVRHVAPTSLATGWPNEEQTFPILRSLAISDPAEIVRQSALQHIAFSFKDNPETFSLFCDWAENAVYTDVRAGSVRYLAGAFSDKPETLRQLREWGINSNHSEVRAAAIQTLALHFKAEPSVLNILQDRALHDASEDVRTTAIRSLANSFSDESGTLETLRSWAVNATQPDIRSAAVQMIGVHYKDNTDTLVLLEDRIVNDESPQVRKIAITTLIEYYKNDDRTLPLLRDIASGDIPAEESTRAQAISALAVNWPNESGTLPLLDSLRDEHLPETIGEAAREASLKVRKRRAAAWIDWLNGQSAESSLSALPTAVDGFPAITVRAVRLENIRAFADTDELYLGVTNLTEPEDIETKSDILEARPLTILLGENATGKSTWLRCIALAALGPEMANQLEKRPESYLRHGAKRGLIEVLFNLQLDEVSESGALGTFCIGLEIRAGENSFLATDDANLKLGQRNASERLNVLRRRVDDRFGFLCAYGATRGLSDNPSALLPEEPKESHERVISLFRSTSPLMDPDVLGKMLVGDLSNFRSAPTRKLDDSVLLKMVDYLKKLLPEVAGLSQEQNACMTLHGISVPLRDLSEGYGSLLALIGHLFRHSLSTLRWNSDPSQIYGVVLIDEIDLHLHPAWQRRVLPNLRSVFPNLQIICTTHSPMVAGSVSTDSVVVLRREDETIRLLCGSELPQVKGWTADEILTSILFELQTTRDIQTEEVFYRYAELLKERGPDDPGVQELGRRAWEGMKFGGVSGVEYSAQQMLNEMLIEKFQALDEQTRNLLITQAEYTLSNGGQHRDQD
jgi:hypothetical protein